MARHFTISAAIVGLAAACGTRTMPTSVTAPTPVAAAAQTPLAAPSAPVEQINFTGHIVEARGSGIPGAKVTVKPLGPGEGGVTAPAVSVTTDASGSYTFSAPSGSQVDVLVERDGYDSEFVQFGIAGKNPTTHDIRLQPIILVSEQSHITTLLTSDDLVRWTGDPYEGDACGPCKEITIRVDRRTRVGITVVWSGDAPLSIWLNGVKGLAQSDSASLTLDAEPSTSYLLLVGVSDWGTGLRLPADVTIDVTTADVAMLGLWPEGAAANLSRR